MSFIEKWAVEFWPALEAKYSHVLAQRPAKQDVATGTRYGEQVCEILTKKKEVRNVSCNLAFTDPTANTTLQQAFSVETVERFAIDTFLDPTPAPSDDDQVAASAAQVTASAAADTSVVGEDGAGGRQAEQILRAKKQWRIPARVPRGYEIPIAINSLNEPEKGKFKRLGIDVVVNATWLAFWGGH